MHDRTRLVISDTLALLIYSTLGAGISELFIAGMAWEQVVWARFMAIPAILLTGWPYGLYRDWLFRVGRAQSQLRRLLFDTFAFISFQMPVYAAILWTAGATLPQILTAISSAIVVISISGRPYGLLLEAMRRLFRVSPDGLVQD